MHIINVTIILYQVTKKNKIFLYEKWIRGHLHVLSAWESMIEDITPSMV